MFPVATAATFARKVAGHGIFEIYFSVFKIYYVLFSIRFVTISVTCCCSDKPVCHGGATVLYRYPQSITIISMSYYDLICSDAVSCVLMKA